MPETLETIGQKLGALDEKVGALDEKIGALDEKVGALDEKVGALDEKVGALDEKVGALDEKVGALDEKVGALDDKFETRFASMDKRFARLEQAVRDGDEQTRTYLGIKIDGVADQVKLIFEKIDAIDQRDAKNAEWRIAADDKLENHDLRILALERPPETR